MPKYIGLTIGPIVKTLNNAKKTGQLWGASYIFSYLMKNIIRPFKDERNFIVPYVENNKYFKPGLGAGLFHDRCIFESKDGDFEKIQSIINENICRIANQIHKELDKDITAKEIKKYLKNYFRVYFIEEELDSNENPILKLSPYLDSLELQPKIIPEKDTDESYLLDFLLNHNVKESFLTKDAFNESLKIESTPEIACSDLVDVLDERKIKELRKDEEEFYRVINEKLRKKYDKELKKYHKYFAVVQADGDNIRKIIEQLSTDNNFREYKNFSKKLFEFALNSTQEIDHYGGLPIYAGGDDLFFFAPVINKNRSVFDLIDELDVIFNEIFEQEIEKLEQKPRLSFGVAVNYYKYPLYEAVEAARNLLFNDAKNYKIKGKEKNAVALRVLKHSGHYFKLTLNKGSNTYQRFRKLLDEIKKGEKFLSSIMYKLAREESLIKRIVGNRVKLENYFENSFKKEVHNDINLKEIRRLVREAYSELKKDEAMETIKAILQFIRFIAGEEVKDEEISG